MLIELENYARANEFDINTFLVKMQTLDDPVTNFALLVFECYRQMYNNKFFK